MATKKKEDVQAKVETSEFTVKPWTNDKIEVAETVTAEDLVPTTKPWTKDKIKVKTNNPDPVARGKKPYEE